MPEYIEREALLEECHWVIRSDGTRVFVCHAEDIENAPTADVAQVRHGRWIWKLKHRGGFYQYTGVDDCGETHTITVDKRIVIDEPYCPFCGKLNDSAYLDYCPNCGADMDGGETDAGEF